MRIQRIEKVAVVTLNPQEQSAIKMIATQLKSVAPGMGALLQNPNNLTFLMKFFEAIGQNTNAIGILRNSMATIKRAMEKDQTATMAFLGKV